MSKFSSFEKVVKKQLVGGSWVSVTLSAQNRQFPFGVKLDMAAVAARFKSAEDAMAYAVANIKQLREDISEAA